MITSASNSVVRGVKLLQTSRKIRHERGLYVLEGRILFAEAAAHARRLESASSGQAASLQAARNLIHTVYVTKEGAKVHESELDWLHHYGGVPIQLVSPNVLSKMSDVQTVNPSAPISVLRMPSGPCGVAAWASRDPLDDDASPGGGSAAPHHKAAVGAQQGSKKNHHSSDGDGSASAAGGKQPAFPSFSRCGEEGAPASFAVVCDRIGDPANLAAILRTADAAGVDAVFVTPDTVDPWNPKTVRGGAGSHLRLPIICADWPAIVGEHLPDFGIWYAQAREGVPMWSADWSGPAAQIGSSGQTSSKGGGKVALTLTSETRGLSYEGREALLSHTSGLLPVHIPIAPLAESLNVSMAAGVLMMEVVRQRAHPAA
jgi:tRNA G18 (ribose-2'-O)-methylase SpoU